MKKLLASLMSVVLFSVFNVGIVSAAPKVVYPTGCETTSYTAIGGYYSQGNFYQQDHDTLTIKAQWCYANNLITSHHISYTTTIPANDYPRLIRTIHLNKAKTSLGVGVNGDYDSGVLNNVGFIGATGTITSLGTYSFSTTSGNGG